jgi:hypothetical protein
MFVTDIQDARVMKRMGAPLNTPVEHKVFDGPVSKHWLQIAKAEIGFDDAFAAYIERPNAGELGKFRLMKRRNEALHKAAANASLFVEQYDQDLAQQFLLSELVGRSLNAVTWWRDTLSACEAGETLEIALGDVPRAFPLED